MSGSAKHEDEGAASSPELEVDGEAAEAKAGLLEQLLELDPSAVAIAHVDAASARLGTRVGRLVEWAPGEAPKIEFAGNERGPLPARSVIPLSPTQVMAAIQDRRGVLLTFEDGRPDAPIITGVLQPLVPAAEPGEREHEREPGEGEELELEPAEGEGEGEGEGEELELDARVDGKRVELEAADEIVLRCGKASIVLRRNGRVVIRGTYVETRSRGVNRIKGGSVEIN